MVQNYMGDMDSTMFMMSTNSFQNFYEKQFMQDGNLGNNQYKIDEALSAISFQQLNNPALTMILTNILTQSKDTDKTYKANRICRDLQAISPEKNALVWDLFEKIIVWAANSLKASFSLVLEVFLSKCLSWMTENNSYQRYAGYRLFSTLFKFFPASLESNINHYRTLITKFFKSDETEYYPVVLDALRTLMDYDKTTHNEVIQLLCKPFKSGKAVKFPGVCIALWMILERYPDDKIHFSISSLPMDTFFGKELNLKLATVPALPILIRVAPDLFTDELINNIFKTFEPLLKKKAIMRNEVLLDFSRFIFFGGIKKDDDIISNIKKCRKEIYEAVDSPEAAAALLACDIYCQDFITADTNRIYSQLHSLILSSSLKCFLEVCPSFSDTVYRNVLIFGNDILLNISSPPDKIAALFNVFVDLNIPSSNLSPALILEYSNHLSSQSKEVRLTCFRYLLKYNNDNPSTEVMHRIFTSISTEQDKETRLEILSNVNVKVADNAIILAIQQLLHDLDSSVRRLSFEIMVKLANYEAVPPILSSILSERLKYLQNAPEILKENILPFSVVANAAFSEPPQVYSANCRQVFVPFSQFLTKFLLSSKKRLDSVSLQLLTHLVTNLSDEINIDLLVQHIEASLLPHSSMGRLSAALNLMYAALKFTTLRHNLIEDHSSLLAKYMTITNMPKTAVDRKVLLKVLGLIGAPKPSLVINWLKKKEKTESSNTVTSPNIFISKSASNDPDQSLLVASIGIGLINILDILGDESLASLHSYAIDSLIKFLKVNRSLEEDFESLLMMRVNALLQSRGTSTTSVLLSNMATLVTSLGARFKPLVPQVIDLICEQWGKIDPVTFTRTTEWLAISLPKVFVNYLPRIALLFTKDFAILQPKAVHTILSCLVSFGTLLNQVDHIIIPPILSWLLDNAMSTTDVMQTLIRFKQICILAGGAKFAGPIFSTLISVVKANKDVHNQCLEILFVIACQMGTQFAFHKSYLQEVFDFSKHQDLSIVAVLSEIGTNFPQSILDKVSPQNSKISRSVSTPKNQLSNTSKLEKLPDFTIPSANYSESNWITWYNEISSICFNESPSKSICACISLAERHAPVHDSLFPISFAIYYFAAEVKQDDKIQQIMKTVFKSTSTPRHILKHFLDVIELIEVVGANIPIPIQILKTRAQGVNNTAQALRFAEKLFDEGDEEVSEDLIVLNQMLGLPLAANGILRCSKARANNQQEGELSEKLGLWNDALQMYDEKLKEDPNNQRYIIGRLTCLNELARYKDLMEAVKDDPRNTYFIGSAAYNLFDDQTFMSVAKDISPRSRIPNDLFFALIYAIKTKNFENALDILARLQAAKVDKVFPMIYEDYERAYEDTSMVSITQELYEVIQYMQAADRAIQPNPSEQSLAKKTMERIKNRWRYRFKFLPDRPNVLFQHIRVQSLVLPYEGLRAQYLSYLDCAIRHGESHISLLESTLEVLMGTAPDDTDLRYDAARLLWLKGNKALAYIHLEGITREGGDTGMAELTLTKWFMSEGKLQQAAQHIVNAIRFNPNSVDSWNTSSLLFLEYYDATKDERYIIQAIDQAFNALCFSVDDPLAFTLRILSLLFNHENQGIYDIFEQRISSVPVQVWIDVLPQIIARASTEDDRLREIIFKLLVSVGREFPHVILSQLMVPYRDDKTIRQKVAAQTFEALTSIYPDLVRDMMSFTDEMIRVAVTWWEQWFGILDEASRAYLLRNDINEMCELLEPLNEVISKEPSTYFEVSFLAQFGLSLANAHSCIKEYRRTQNEQCVLSAWQTYYSVYQDLKPMINSMSTILLADASPILHKFSSKNIIVPGTFSHGKPLVTLSSIAPELTVMKSKQRPRRMIMFGDDGKKYTFLLKAHEDTRLDERVMQLFGFINTLVEHSDIPMKNHLDITTYKVIPLTTSVGLIGWVQGCSTVYDQIKQRREKAGIPLELECQTTYKAAPNYEQLPLDDKLFAFKRGLNATKGDDLKILLLAQANDSNHWIERRTAYSTSLAMTSMAGYILGLGDRHLCNIMIKQKSAKLVHIDFGDCFEVAQHREKAPEKVPFRLTRILSNALEVSRIEGTFRSCCENVMNLMRSNSETINGILEVFVYDPLQQWIEESKDEHGGDAKVIINRIKDKLSGRDFPEKEKLTYQDQVDRLIQEATDANNLCQMFKGWHPWW
ncbi:PIKK family atypical protein kinase [Trichomonas vaginalis G3]|uniref:non-specific serine/threonine protein kinase n=1 Tax=Trichomonas vaginalis (strain ATCC PRA-98 / G3) TaxID=412133 RepID=A2DPM5_TRIV3|nr:ataxia telangiectasia mutated (ATM) -related family [Trichomonas vaginalis G3]EAY17625.1 PIKK family atypical protein kinase [Trichomonas vaginalis G3]KAI5486130.1 ataxia telangiectasia mutated (ATM) -related family [Trichomonas vaginalis G3]|eukprot:XP_001329760.1 PIKK family atypical protein kinase [Trichomonas vaginalis G3]